jgi:hypothetical protein
MRLEHLFRFTRDFARAAQQKDGHSLLDRAGGKRDIATAAV